MRKVEKIREMVRGITVKPTLFNSDFFSLGYERKKKAVAYLKEKGCRVEKCEGVIEDIENFLQSASVVIKTDSNAIKELMPLPARKTDEMYQHFLRKCELVEKSMNAYLDRQLSTLFNLIKDHTVDYRDVKNTDMNYLLEKDAPAKLEIEVEGYGKLLLLWHGATGATNFLVTDYRFTEEDEEAIKRGIFNPKESITAGKWGEFFNFYTAPNTDCPEFIISDSTIEKIRFDGVKKLYLENEYYYYDFAVRPKKKGKVLKLNVNL